MGTLTGTVRDSQGNATSRDVIVNVDTGQPQVWGPGILQWMSPMPESIGLTVVGPLSEANNLGPGDTLLLAPGTYGAKGTTFSWTKAGLPTNPCTIAARPGDYVKIVGRVMMNGPWQRFRNIHFEGPTGPVGGPGPGGEAILLNLGSHVEVDFCEVYGDQWHAGISPSGSTDYRVLNCYVHDNGGLNGDFTTADSQWNTSHGMYISPSSYGLIANCVVEHNDAKGIMGRHDSNHIIIAHCTVVANGRFGSEAYEQSHDWIWANNVFLNNGNSKGGGGISMGGVGPYVNRNNVLFHNGTNGTTNISGTGTSIAPLIADPKLVRPAVWSDHQVLDPQTDNHLLFDSPCIGYGDPSFIISTDKDGRPRNGRADCGAYQF